MFIGCHVISHQHHCGISHSVIRFVFVAIIYFIVNQEQNENKRMKNCATTRLQKRTGTHNNHTKAKLNTVSTAQATYIWRERAIKSTIKTVEKDREWKQKNKRKTDTYKTNWRDVIHLTDATTAQPTVSKHVCSYPPE